MHIADKRGKWLAVGTLIAFSTLLYLPVIHHYLGWDDYPIIFNNPHLNQFSIRNLIAIWTEPYARMYIPITWTLWLYATLPSGISASGTTPLQAGPFHALNLIFHVANTVLVFFVLYHLLGVWNRRRDSSEAPSIFAAFAGALLYSVHPIQVESVAWVSGFPGVAATFFSLLAILFYRNTSGGERNQISTYIFTVLAFVGALLCKPSAVALPLLLLGFDLVVKRLSFRQSVGQLTPVLILGILFAYLAKSLQPDAQIPNLVPVVERPIVALHALGFYLVKIIAPFNLTFDYGHTPKAVIASKAALWYCGLAVVTAVLALAFRIWRRWALFFALMTFLVPVLPVLGIIPFYSQIISTVGDRYIYFSILAPSFLVALLIQRSRSHSVVPLAFASLIAGYTVLTARQIPVWEKAETLYRHTLKINPKSHSAHVNLGNLMGEMGDRDAAREHYLKALKEVPTSPLAHNNLAIELIMEKKYAQAEEHLRKSLEAQPDYDKASENLSLLLAMQGRYEAAVEEFARFNRIPPVPYIQQAGFADFLAQRGHVKESVPFYRRAIALQPNLINARNNLVNALTVIENRKEAKKELLALMKLAPQIVSQNPNLMKLLRDTEPVRSN